MQEYVLFQPWLHVLQLFSFFLRKVTRHTHAHTKDMIVHCIVLTQSLALHCYKQQDNDDMKNISMK
jgi:hypothetical protein